MTFELDYDEMVLLDAEDLAERGIKSAYEALLPKLRAYVAEPDTIEEVDDPDEPRYVIRYGDREFVIDAPELENDEGQSWGRAGHAFFSIVNDQLRHSEFRLYAINGGNDLGGMFLTSAQAEASRETLTRKRDWPYLMTDAHPWYGQYH